MSDLRVGAVEAIARAVWPNDYENAPEVVVPLVEAHLDALLLFLGEHTEEWSDAEAQLRPRLLNWTRLHSSQLQRILAVLGSGEEKP